MRVPGVERAGDQVARAAEAPARVGAEVHRGLALMLAVLGEMGVDVPNDE